MSAAVQTGVRGAARGRGWARTGLWLAVAAVFLVLPHLFPSGTGLTTMSLMAIMIIFALSYNMLLGQTGMLSFGHAVYYGLGGFLVVHAMNAIIGEHLPVPLVVLPLVGGVAGLVFGIIFGSVSTRRGGTAFAMISLGLGELVGASALILRDFFGGEDGITTNRTKLLHVAGFNFGPQLQVYYLIAGWCLLCMMAMYALTRTPFGRICNAVRDNPERAAFIGYNTQSVRFIAFCLAGLFAGIAGGLTAINFEIMNAANVGAAPSGIVLLMTYIGGVGNFAGPVIGAILITFLQVMLSDATEIWQLYLGLLFIVMVSFAPGGIAGLIAMHAPVWRARLLHRLLPAYALALLLGLITFAGAALALEMAYRLSAGSEGGTAFRFLHVPVDAASAAPWSLAALLAVPGFLAFRRVLPIVGNVWATTLAEARQGRGR